MERVVVTGMGIVTPNGIGIEATWDSLSRGESKFGEISLFDHTDCKTHFAGEVTGFEPSEWMPKKKVKETSRFIPFAMAATKMALEDADLNLTDKERDRVGCFIGVGLGGLENLQKVTLHLHREKPKKISPYFIPSIIPHLAAGQVAIEHGFRGPSYSHTSACSSGSHAIGEAVEWIRRGRAHAMIAGGAEATIARIGISGFNAMYALSTRNDEPTRASRPFDKDRDGFVVGEGSGILVLESLTRAKKRGANIIGEILGWGASTDAFHITKPSPDASGAIRCMEMALEDSSLDPDKIDYINAHGTSTPVGDIAESTAVSKLFGTRATDKLLPMSSTKSMTGHLLGAAGAAEAVLSLEMMRRGILLPTINLDEPDEECRLDYVANTAREQQANIVMSNSFGFGGTNATLVMARYQD